MPTLRAIRRRISSIRNIQQVTNAMHMVAAVKLRRAQENIVAARPYARRMDALLRHLASRADRTRHPLLVEREPHKVCLVVVASDRGLCGSFNTNIARRALAQLRSYEGLDAQIVCVGRRGRDFFRRRGYPLLAEHVNFFNALAFHHAASIAGDLMRLYAEGGLDRIDVVYNEFKSALRQDIVVEQLLPIVPEPPAGDAYFIDYLYEPSPDALLDILLPRHLNFQMWRILLESNAAEQGARMTAMENATSNAHQLIDELTLDLNKARQTAITKELMDIVGGSEALK